MILSRDAILSAKDLHEKTLDIPEWGGSIRLIELSEGEVSRYFDGPNTPSRLIAMSISDEQGNRIFTEDDVSELQKKNLHILQRLFKECLQLNLMSAESVDPVKKK